LLFWLLMPAAKDQVLTITIARGCGSQNSREIIVGGVFFFRKGVRHHDLFRSHIRYVFSY
jgi:hypothetical protein